MTINEDARVLVASIRGIAKTNEDEASRSHNEQRRAWLEGRASAYYLAARWLEEIIEEADGE